MKKIRNSTVFIVEENEEYSFMLDYIISRDNDCRIYRFNSKDECLRNLYLCPGLIILDDPGSAIDTLRAIKQQVPDAHVVILAEKENIDMAIRCMMEGAEDYLMKKKDDLIQIREIVDTVLHTQ